MTANPHPATIQRRVLAAITIFSDVTLNELATATEHDRHAISRALQALQTAGAVTSHDNHPRHWTLTARDESARECTGLSHTLSARVLPAGDP